MKRTPLSRGAPLDRRTGLARTPFTTTRREASSAGIAKVNAEGRCRACGREWWLVGGLERHHLIFRSQGGRWDEDNLVPLCRECHDRVHGSGKWEVRVAIRRSLTPFEVSYVVAERGQGWLDAYYPTSPPA